MCGLLVCVVCVRRGGLGVGHAVCLSPLDPGILPHSDKHGPHSDAVLHTSGSAANAEGMCSTGA